jgi:hypothetical protein
VPGGLTCGRWRPTIVRSSLDSGRHDAARGLDYSLVNPATPGARHVLIMATVKALDQSYSVDW